MMTEINLLQLRDSPIRIRKEVRAGSEPPQILLTNRIPIKK